MKKLKIKLYQKLADTIVKQVEKTVSKKEMVFWFNFGISFNEWCVSKDIFLD